MAGFIVKIVNALPETLTPNTWYIVKSATAGFISSVMTGKDTTDVYKFPSLETLSSTLTEMSSTKALPNKIPIGNESGQIDPTYFDILPSTTSVTLHKSPNPVTVLFIYDTTKDSDGGAWTDKCQHTSWYNEPLCGKWLGAQTSENAARAITGATTNDYFQLTTDGKFYKLNAGSGTTEVFRGNKANFPKIAAFIAEKDTVNYQALTIYDLTELNSPMWMVFKSTISAYVYGDIIGQGRVISSISGLNGLMVLTFGALGYNSPFSVINFVEDTLQKPSRTNVGFIGNRLLTNMLIPGNTGYNGILPDYYTNCSALLLSPNEPIGNNVPKPTILIGSGYTGSNGGIYIVPTNKQYVKSSSTIEFNQLCVNNRLLIAGSITNNNIYYALNPKALGTSFTLTTMASTAAPYFNDALTAKLKQMTIERYLLHGNQNSVRQLMANVNTYARSLTTRTTSNEQIGWLVGNIRRCYMGDNQVSAMLTNTLIPPISNAKLVQRLGSEYYAWSLLSLGNGIVLAGTNPTGQIYRSTDNGLSFMLVQRLGSETYVLSLLSLGNGIVLAGTNPTGQIYRSSDNGLSFTLIQRLGSETQVFSLLSLGNGIVLAGTYPTGQIYRSTDNGLSFTLIQRLGSETYVLSLLSLGNGIVLAGTYPTGQIYRSTDNGLTFTLVQRLGSETLVLSLLSLGNGVVLAGTGTISQIYRSTDNGLSFTLIQRLGSETYVYSLLSLGNGVVLAGTGATGQIYRSTDNGLSFTLIQRLGSETYVYSLLSLGNGVVLAGTGATGQIYRYTFPVITGTLTKTAVATNTDLTAYSGFSNTNYVREVYSSDLDFGTAEWSISAWVKIPSTLLVNNFPNVTLSPTQLLGNNTFDTDYSGWSLSGTGGTAVVSNGLLTVTTGTATTIIQRTLSLKLGYTYALVVVKTAGNSTNNTFRLNSVNIFSPVLVNGTNTYYFTTTAVSNTVGIALAGAAGETATIDSISLYEMLPLTHSLIAERSYSSGSKISLGMSFTGYLTCEVSDGTTTRTVTSVNAYNLDTWIKVRANYRTDGSLSLSVNGVEEATTYGAPLLTLNNTNAVLTLGNNYALDAPFPGSLCLVKLSATVPTPDQMAFMFAEESQLFRDNARCTLPDTSGIVDLTYDDETDTWTSVSATYKAEWNGLVRTKSSALTSGTYAKVESRSGIALEAITDTLSEVRYSKIRKNLRGLLSPFIKTIADIGLEYTGGFTATTTNGSTSITSIASMSIPQETTHYEAVISGTGITTDTQLYNIVGTTGYLSKPATANGTAVQIAFRDFILPPGYTAVEVSVAGSLKQEGASKDYTRLFDGFRETIRFGTAPGYNAWVSIEAIPAT